MQHLMALFILAFSFQTEVSLAQNLSSEQFWLSQGFSDLSYESIPPYQPNQESLKIDVIVLKDSAWGRNVVVDHLKKSQQYYWNNCSFNIGPIEIYIGKNPSLETMKMANTMKLVRVKPDSQVPTIYFLKQDQDFPRATGFASMWIELEKSLVASTNTIVMFEPAILYKRLFTYDVLIHELAHVFIGESDFYNPQHQGNILSGYYDGHAIRKDQCEQIKSKWSHALSL